MKKMIKFKLNTLLTTSVIAFVMSAQASHAGQVMTNPETKVNQSSSAAKEQAAFSFKLLTNRANAGDKSAEEIIKKFNLDVNSDPQTIREAVTAYRDKRKPMLGDRSSTAAKISDAAAPQKRPPLSENLSYKLLKNKADRGNDLAKKIMNDFKLDEATDPDVAKKAIAAYTAASQAEFVKQRGGGSAEVGSAKAEASAELTTTPTKSGGDACEKEVHKYKQEINALKAELETAKLAVANGGKIGAEEQKIYDELENFLKNDSTLLYKKVKELLESLLKENESEIAITKFLTIVNKYQGSDARGEKVNTIYIKLNEEGSLKEYLKAVMRKELQVEQREIYAEGDKTLTVLPPQPDLKLLLQNPLLMVCYTDKDKVKGFWLTTNLKTYNQFIISTKPEHLKAVYTYLTKKWKLRHPLDVVNTTPMDDFVISIYEQIKSKKKPAPLKLSVQQVEEFIKERIKTDLPIDYTKMEQENLRYEKEFKAINIQEAIKKNPFLKILEVKDSDQWKVLDFERSAYDKMVDFLSYSTLSELKAILYHLSKMEFSSKGDLNEQYFYKAVNEQVNAKDKQGQTNASKNITSSVVSEMNRVVAKIQSGAPIGDEPMKKGTAKAPPPLKKGSTPPTPPKPPSPPSHIKG